MRRTPHGERQYAVITLPRMANSFFWDLQTFQSVCSSRRWLREIVSSVVAVRELLPGRA
jgi:hypothetical protein